MLSWRSFSTAGQVVSEGPTEWLAVNKTITITWSQAEMSVRPMITVTSPYPCSHLTWRIMCYQRPLLSLIGPSIHVPGKRHFPTLECAISALTVLQGGTSPRTSELKRGSRMHVLIEGSLNRLHCCGNETPAANEHRLDCFLGRERAKTALWSRSVHGVPPPPPPSFSCPCCLRLRSFTVSLHLMAAISHLLINFLRLQITILLCFCLHLLKGD